jgi:hypothetical protein
VPAPMSVLGAAPFVGLDDTCATRQRSLTARPRGVERADRSEVRSGTSLWDTGRPGRRCGPARDYENTATRIFYGPAAADAAEDCKSTPGVAGASAGREDERRKRTAANIQTALG